MSSGIRDIGRTSVGFGHGSSNIPGMRDMIVVRVRFKSGYPDMFAFANKERTYDTTNTLPQERAPETDLPIDETKFHGMHIPDDARIQIGPAFEHFIDAEFVDAAIERHLEVWGTAPETIVADDSNWVWDKQRSQQAKENKAREPGPFGIPKMHLPSSAELRNSAPPLGSQSTGPIPSTAGSPLVPPDQMQVKECRS
jgi:hypothetical protein